MVISPKANSTLAKNVDDYVTAFKNGNSARQGQLGEDIAEQLARELDNGDVLNVKINNSGHGFDVLQFENGVSNPTTIRMFESKPLNGTSVELPNTTKGTQMSGQWQFNTIQQMVQSTDNTIQDLGNILLQNQSRIERYILTIDKDLRQIVILKLDNF